MAFRVTLYLPALTTAPEILTPLKAENSRQIKIRVCDGSSSAAQWTVLCLYIPPPIQTTWFAEGLCQYDPIYVSMIPFMSV